MPEFAYAALVTGDKGDRRIVPLNQVIDIQGLVENKQDGVERVADFQFGVFRLYYSKTAVAKILEHAVPVRLPRYLHGIIYLKVLETYMIRKDWIGAIVLVEIGQEILPIVQSDISRQDIQCADTRFLRAADIAPEAFQCSCADYLMVVVPDGGLKDNEVFRGLDFFIEFLFDLFPEL
ncbi:MAG: hypothetical protein IJT26_03830 [Bacteroidales bacterium]|nr:hypothetical protein [Bacteroidales bacterium]